MKKTLGNHTRALAMAAIALSLPLAPFTSPLLESATAAGRITPPVVNTLLNGKGVPTKQLGSKGDFYIDVVTYTIYGPKAATSWPTGISLRTASSSTTPSSNIITNPKNVPSPGVLVKGPAGPQGAPGLQGEKGDRGETGPAGVPGATGANGKDGEPGLVGSAGPTGPAGSPGANGGSGPAGVQGVQGVQGIQGAAGPSAVTTGLITFADLIATPGGSSTSAPFGNLQAGKKYLINFIIRGVSSMNSTIRTGANINFQAGVTKILDAYSISTGESFRGGVLKVENNLSGFMVLSADSAFSGTGISVSVSAYLASTIDALTLTGSYTCQEVGSVS